MAALAGVVLGLLFGGVAVYAGSAASLASFAGAGLLAGSVSGLLLPAGAIDFFFGTVHFLAGFLAIVLGHVDEDAPSRLYRGDAGQQRWPRWAFLFGVAFAMLLEFL